MYQDYFGLKEIPFSIAPNPRYLFMSQKHREALAHLIYGVSSSGGFVLLTGEVGTGKTTTCRCFLEQIPENVKVAFIFNPKLSVEELLATICDELGISYLSDHITLKDYVDYINSYLLHTHAEGQKTVLIIDEAQNLDEKVLEQLRLLTNLETNQEKLLQIILIGQPELRDIFEKPQLRQLAQRITARFHLDNLTLDETYAYIRHRLAVAGTDKPLFPEKVIKKLHAISGGIPRLINVIADRALLGAYVKGRLQVDEQILIQSAKEVLGEKKKTPFLKRHRKELNYALVASLILVLGISVGVWVGSGKPNTQPLAQLESHQQTSKPPQSIAAASSAPLLPKLAAASAGVSKDENAITDGEQLQQVFPKLAMAPTITAPNVVEGIQQDVLESDDQNLNVAEGGGEIEETLNVSPEKQIVEIDSNEGIRWPQDINSTPSLYQAYKTLFDLWQLNYDPAENGGDPCDFAKKNGLACLQRKGSFDSLEKLNLPAVLTLYPRDGNYVYATLIGMDDNQLQFVVGDESLIFSRDQLAQIWRNEYSVLWKLPPGYKGVIRPNTIGPEVKWLREQLETVSTRVGDLDIQSRGEMQSYYDDKLLASVKKLQRQAGLEDDGIIGVQTYILLNSIVDDDSPKVVSMGLVQKGAQ